MNNILIIGKNSYIGNEFEEWIKKNKINTFKIDFISVREDSWELLSFRKYDTIIYLSSIVHNIKNKNHQEYFYVNSILPFKVACKAKNENVNHFIYFSTMSVYGEEGSMISELRITNETKCNPKNIYGKSKLYGEELVDSLKSEDFIVSIVRPPIVYGLNCKGNFNNLKKVAYLSFLFPDINNVRSMIHITNLCISLKKIIDLRKNGIYFPQNKSYVSTKEIIKELNLNKNRVILHSKILSIIIKRFFKNFKLTKKIYGNLVYCKNISSNIMSEEYIDFKDSIKLSIKQR